MAGENDIPLKVTVDGAGAGKTLGDLRKEITGLTNELLNAEKGTQKYTQTALQLGKVKAEFKDIREQVAALDPEKRAAAFSKLGNALAGGFQAATGAAALFGVEAEEVNKALLKVQAATALAQGIQSVTELGKGFQTLGIIIKGAFAANPIGVIVAGVIALGTAAYALYQNLKPASDEMRMLNQELDRQKIATEEANRVIDNQIISLEGVRGKEEEVLKLKRQKIENSIKEVQASLLVQEQNLKEAQTQDTLIEKLIQYGELVGLNIPNTAKVIKEARVKEQLDALNETKKNLENLQALFTQSETAITNFNLDQSKKRQDEKDKETNYEIKRNQDAIDFQTYSDNYFEDLSKTDKAKKEEEREKELQAQADFLNKSIEQGAKAYDEDKKNYEAANKAKVDLTQGTFNVIGELANAFAGKSEASQRRAFEINKAASIASTIIGTWEAAQGAYKSQLTIPTPDAPIRAAVAAGIAVATGLARVAVIAKTQFKSSSASGGGSISTPNLGSGGGNVPSPPQFNPNSTQTNTDQQGNFTGFNNQKPEPIKAYVTEVDLSESQRRINTLRKRAEF